MSKCEICRTNPATLSAIIGDFYYKNICDSCKSANSQVSSGHARWARSIDAEDHEADIQQPFGSDGKPNAKFAKLYPKQSKAVMTPEQFRRASL